MTEATQPLLPVTPELLPCPFCDGEAKWIEDPGVCGVPFGLVVDHQPSCFFGLFASITDAEQITRWNTRSQSHSLPGDVGMREALEEIAGAYDEWQPEGEYSSTVLYQVSQKARAALTPSPCPGDGMREALTDIFAAWDAHVEANDRTNAAIPDIDATRAERAVYDERYRASEEAKREWYRAMHRFIDNPATRAALTPSALSGDAGEGELIASIREQVAKLYCAAGCDCCRSTEAWNAASEKLGELLGVPQFDDGSGVNWWAVKRGEF